MRDQFGQTLVRRVEDVEHGIGYRGVTGNDARIDLIALGVAAEASGILRSDSDGLEQRRRGLDQKRDDARARSDGGEYERPNLELPRLPFFFTVLEAHPRHYLTNCRTLASNRRLVWAHHWYPLALLLERCVEPHFDGRQSLPLHLPQHALVNLRHSRCWRWCFVIHVRDRRIVHQQ